MYKIIAVKPSPLIHSGQQGKLIETLSVGNIPFIIKGLPDGIRSSYHADLFLETLPQLINSYEKRTNKKIKRACETGTARGTVAVAMALANPQAKITAIDFLDKYVALAKENAGLNCVSDRFKAQQGDVLSSCQGQYDILISTLPSMITMEENFKQLDQDSFIEISGGFTGNELILKFIEQAKNYLSDQGEIWLTMFDFSHLDEVLQAMQKNGFKPTIVAQKRKYLNETKRTQAMKPFIEKTGYRFQTSADQRLFFNVVIIKGIINTSR